MAAVVKEMPLVWSIIPARGGSKGVPGKNLKKIFGQSLVAHTVSAARGARCVGRVFVSTDDASIAAEATRAGAEIIDRPAALATDTASSEAALLDALNQLEANGQILPEIVVFLQCTSPFMTASDIDGTVRILLNENADTAHTVIATHGFIWRRGNDGSAEGVNHDKAVRLRRQDREPEFLETGAVYAMRTVGFRIARHRFFGKTVLYEVTSARAMEIDTQDNLAEARLLAPLIEPEIQASVIPDPLVGVVFDFDGVMTDDRVTVSEDGAEAVVCSRADGMGLSLLKQHRIRLAVLSREKNAVVANRCGKLGIDCICACEDKLTVLNALCKQWGCALENIIFVGNDVPDIGCLQAAGLGVVVADAHPQASARADLVLSHRGGFGAVRELCDIILSRLVV